MKLLKWLIAAVVVSASIFAFSCSESPVEQVTLHEEMECDSGFQPSPVRGGWREIKNIPGIGNPRAMDIGCTHDSNLFWYIDRNNTDRIYEIRYTFVNGGINCVRENTATYTNKNFQRLDGGTGRDAWLISNDGSLYQYDRSALRFYLELSSAYYYCKDVGCGVSRYGGGNGVRVIANDGDDWGVFQPFSPASASLSADLCVYSNHLAIDVQHTFSTNNTIWCVLSRPGQYPFPHRGYYFFDQIGTVRSYDIAVQPINNVQDPVTWLIGGQIHYLYGGPIYRYCYGYWIQVEGLATYISIDSKGNVFVVNKQGKIYASPNL